MSAIKATPSDSKVSVEWKTESEVDNAGFNVWRAEFEKINASLIPAKGSPTFDLECGMSTITLPQCDNQMKMLLQLLSKNVSLEERAVPKF